MSNELLIMLVALRKYEACLSIYATSLLVFVSFMENFTEIPSFFQFSVLLKDFFCQGGRVVVRE